MKVLHVPFTFHPDPVGGTEVYVGALAQRQQIEGTHVVVAAPALECAEYRYDDICVRRFAVRASAADIGELYGLGDADAAIAFGQVLERERPDLVHLHAFTRGVSVRLVREAKRRGLPVVFSYHTPTVSCQRGTLLRWGSEVCDGRLDVNACTACTLHGLGAHRSVAQAIASIPIGFARMAGWAGLSGGLWTAVRMPELIALRHAAFRGLMTEVDAVVALCDWVKDVLLLNGLASEKITVSRQGLAHRPADSSKQALPRDAGSSPLRVAFVGRLDLTKAPHVLVQALQAEPAIPVTLDVYGVVQGEGGAAYLRELRRLAADDARVTFRGPLPAEDVVSRIREYDALAVPSQWLETGPMVVMEAFAAGIPVLGSNLGGIAELVRHGVDGLLVAPGSVEAWGATLRALSTDRGLLLALRNGVRTPRSISDVAGDMSVLYRKLLVTRDGSASHQVPARKITA